MELHQSNHRDLGDHSYQGPSPPIVQFGQAASSRNWLFQTSFIKNYGGHCALGNLESSIILFVARD